MTAVLFGIEGTEPVAYGAMRCAYCALREPPDRIVPLQPLPLRSAHEGRGGRVMPGKVFIGYSREDADWLALVTEHLGVLELEVWDDTRIEVAGRAFMRTRPDRTVRPGHVKRARNARLSIEGVAQARGP